MASNRYETLVNVLDRICLEAPPAFKSYHPVPASVDAVNAARSRAYIHLYLHVIHGLLEFSERERRITDGTADGGLDAYYIDTEAKQITLLQSKFRTNERNFEEREITLADLLAMETSRIIKGESTGLDGQPYNGKILGFQRVLAQIPDLPSYSWKTVILANLRRVRREALGRLVDGMATEVIDNDRAYNELLFPVVSGNYFNEPDLVLTLDLSRAVTGNAVLQYTVETAAKDVEISLYFVPAIEIGNTLNKYRNAILKYNPRTYLELEKNPVNQEIRRTIVNTKTDEFALFNNGITILSDNTGVATSTGQIGRGRLQLLNPQILNGGQTAVTLSRLCEDVAAGVISASVFTKKDVLVKVITFLPSSTRTKKARMQLIEAISRATNLQSRVEEADRRSNDQLQVDMQKALFERYGCYYERKLGEFADGVRFNYISHEQIVDREQFMRAALASRVRVSSARGANMASLFSKESLAANLDLDRVDQIFFTYRCVLRLTEMGRPLARSKSDRWGTGKYGQALRYGKYAVAAAACSSATDWTDEAVAVVLAQTLGRWRKFEASAVKKRANARYFVSTIDPDTGKSIKIENWERYYKGATVSEDVAKFFAIQPPD